MNPTLALLAHEAFSLALLYTCFCRAIKTSQRTRLGVLVAFYVLSISAVLSLFAPVLFKAWQPDLPGLAMLGAVTLVQVVTSVHWRDGVPRSFEVEEPQP